MKHKGKPANKLVTQNENRTYIKLTKGNCYVTVKTGSGWTDMGQYASAFGKGLNYHYFIFSKGGFTEGLLQAQDRGEVRLLTLADIFK